MALDLSEQIWNMNKILKMEFQEVVNFLIIKKQQRDLEYYLNAKPSVEQKKTIR